MPEAVATSLARRPADLLRQLIRFDTTNPPGNEKDCIAFLHDTLGEAGFTAKRYARSPRRPNLIARLPGRGDAPPLLLQGHIDVVTADHQTWQHPPFGGDLVDGYVWGRGALDMKSGVAMMVCALLRAKEDGVVPAGDVVLAVLSDEESGSDFGAKYLVEHHADVFAGVRYAIGEGGGSTLYMGKRRFYPIAIGEKQMCQLRARVHGPAGHASGIARGGTMTRLSRFLLQLNALRLPAHVTPAARLMLDALVSTMPSPLNRLLRRLYDPALAQTTLALLGPLAAPIEPMFRNTVNATIIRGGEKINVIPSEVTVDLDVRLLPGYGPADAIAEMRQVIGDEVDFEVLRFDTGPGEPDMGLFSTLADILREADPGSIPFPQMMPASSDARFFGRLGIQTYGFLPLKLPAGVDYMHLVHAADERVPAEALTFGADALYTLLQRFGAGAGSSSQGVH